MNLFRLDNVPSTAAMYHADHHVGKMLMEACQLLATAHIKPDVPGYGEMTPQQRLAIGVLPYLHTHVNHPCAVWVRQSSLNYMWALDLADALAAEYRHRFDKPHPAEDVTVITSDAYWRAYRKGLLVTKSWQACQDIKEADDQTDIWEGKLKEAKNALAAWRRRRQSAEKDLSQPLHPHLVDNCNPSPESDEL